MNEQQKLFFQVNAGIKNIVGKELIHSDSIAIDYLINKILLQQKLYPTTMF